MKISRLQYTRSAGVHRFSDMSIMSNIEATAELRDMPTVTATIGAAAIDMRAPATTKNDVKTRYQDPGACVVIMKGYTEPLVVTKPYSRGGEGYLPLRYAGWADAPGHVAMIKESGSRRRDGRDEGDREDAERTERSDTEARD